MIKQNKNLKKPLNKKIIIKLNNNKNNKCKRMKNLYK